MMVNYDDVLKIVNNNLLLRKDLMCAGISIFSIDELIKDILNDLDRLDKKYYADEEELLNVIREQSEYIERLEITLKTIMEVYNK